MYHSPGSTSAAQASQVKASATGRVAYRSETGSRRSNGDGDRWLMAMQHSELAARFPRHETVVSHDARQKYQPHWNRSSASAALIVRAGLLEEPAGPRPPRVVAAEGRADDRDRPDDPVLAEDRRRHRDRALDQLALADRHPGHDDPAEAWRAARPRSACASVIRTRSWARTSSRTSGGANASSDAAGRAGVERRHVARSGRSPGAARRSRSGGGRPTQPDAPDDDRRLAGLLGRASAGRRRRGG